MSRAFGPLTRNALLYSLLLAASASAVVLDKSPLLAHITSQGGGASVVQGVGADGVRGLRLASSAADVGDVLLEVPLSCCLSDFGAEDESANPATQPPEFARPLDWNAQLACSVLAQPPSSPLMESWPDAPPLALFSDLDTELKLVCDNSLEASVVQQRADAIAQYEKVKEASGVEQSAYLDALALVWSRALSVRLPRPIGTRYLLVPYLDLANHDEKPSAIYAASAVNGGVIRLHAARKLSAGDAVTIRYGDWPSAHYATHYGFVPRTNAMHAVELKLSTILESATGETPSEERLKELGLDGDEPQKLYASAPSDELLVRLRAAFTDTPYSECCGYLQPPLFKEGDEEIAALCLQCVTNAAVLAAGKLDDAAEKEMEEAIQCMPTLEVSASGRVLCELREANWWLLGSLARAAAKLANSFSTAAAAEEGSPQRMRAAMSARLMLEDAMQSHEAPPFPIAPRQLEQHAKREWDWEASRYK